jgi:hypothetical protein
LIPGCCRSFSLRLTMKSFLWSFALYLCSGMYRSFTSLQKWRQLVLVNCLAAWPGTISYDGWTVAELFSGKFNVAYCRDPEWKLPTHTFINFPVIPLKLKIHTCDTYRLY